MTLAILATVISALDILKDSEVMQMLDQDVAHGVHKVRDGIYKLHTKLHHKDK